MNHKKLIEMPMSTIVNACNIHSKKFNLHRDNGNLKLSEMHRNLFNICLRMASQKGDYEELFQSDKF